MDTPLIALPLVASLALCASCIRPGASTWMPALGVAATASARHAASPRWAFEARAVATWGGGPPLPAPLPYASPGRFRLASTDTAASACARADACAWERRERAAATRSELSRLGGRR